MSIFNDGKNQNARMGKIEQTLNALANTVNALINNVNANAKNSDTWGKHLNNLLPVLQKQLRTLNNCVADLQKRMAASESMNDKQEAALQGLKQVGAAISQAETQA